MKKIFTLVLCGVICLSLLISGCVQETPNGTTAPPNTSGTIQEDTSIVTAPGEFPVTKEKTTMKFMAPQVPQIEDILTNQFTVEYEEMTNVKIEWEMVPNANKNEMKKLSLSSGDYPDVYFAMGVTQAEEMTYGPRGIFVPLNDLIDKHSMYVKQLMEDWPSIAEQITLPNGNIYSLPRARDTYQAQFSQRYWMNTKWLKELKLEIPTTTEGLYQVLKAFKENDPNGNNKMDEIPLIIANPARASYITNAFVYDNTSNRLVIDGNDKVSVAYTTDGWKKALEYMQRLYKEGLMDQASFTYTNPQIKTLVENANAELVGGVTGHYSSTWADNLGERIKSFEVIAPVKGPDGVQYAYWAPYMHDTGTFTITKAMQNPEIAVRWVDWLFSFEGTNRSRHGIEDVHWEVPPAGTKSYTGKEATWRLLELRESVSNYCWNGMIFPHNMCIHGDQGDSPDGGESMHYRVALEYAKYAPEKVYPPLYIPEDDASEYNKLGVDLRGLVNETMVRLVTSNVDISSEWDKYLSDLENIGLKRYLELSQKYYDNFLEITK